MPAIVDAMSKARRLPLDALPPIFSRREALAAGVTDHQLAGRRLTRLGRGWYATDARGPYALGRRVGDLSRAGRAVRGDGVAVLWPADSVDLPQ